MGITSLELLSPVAMRSNTRGSTQGIGVKGQRLAGFLAALDAKTKDKIVSRLADFYPLDNLSTTRKRAGWVDLKISESYQIGAIGAAHASDGFLRLLALCAIPEFGHKSSLVLLDEIEDGIEPHILPRLIERVVADSKSQFIMTSHSPLLINFFPPEEVMLVTRSDSGESRLKELSNLEVIRAGGEYLGSGEVWANTGLSILNQQALSDLPDEDPENMFEYEWPSRELQRP
jgi:predicted ATPase